MSSKIHFLVRGCFAVAAIFLLHADGSHASVDTLETIDDHTTIQRSYSDRAHVPSSKVIDEHWGMVKTKGSQFVVGDRPFYFNGFNTYWLMMHTVDPSTRGKVTQVFQKAAAVGLTVCRTWAFNDGGHMALQKSPSVYDENAWIQEMAFHVKSIDPDHLLEVGAEGFYGPWSPPARLQVNPNTDAVKMGTDFVRNHRIQGIDFASVHVYPDAWLLNPTMEAQLHFVQSWMQAHIADAEGDLVMPVVFTEFGLSTKTASAFNATSRDQFIQAVYGELLGSMSRCSAGAGGLLWQVFPEGTDNTDDGYSVVLPHARSTANIMSAHSKKLQIINARCG